MGKLKELWESLTDWEKSPIYRHFRETQEARIKRLVGLLGRSATWEEAAESLVKIGPPAVPALVRALGDKDWRVSTRAVVTLGKFGSPTVPALIGALGKKYSGVRMTAAEVLGKNGDSSAIPALIRALGDENSGVRRRAAEAFMEIDPRSSADLRLIANAAREAKKEGKPVDSYQRVYSAWSKKLNMRADAIINDKKFHVPKVKTPGRGTDGMERVLRVRRVGA